MNRLKLIFCFLCMVNYIAIAKAQDTAKLIRQFDKLSKRVDKNNLGSVHIKTDSMYLPFSEKILEVIGFGDIKVNTNKQGSKSFGSKMPKVAMNSPSTIASKYFSSL